MKNNVQKLKKIIAREVFLTKKTHTIAVGEGRPAAWIFDFRSIFLQPNHLDLVADIFLDIFENEYPFQVGGLETASLPLIAGIIMKGKQRGLLINGFYIRKSRKRVGLQNIIEGKLTEDKIILVDDLIDSGRTFHYQIKVLKALKKRVEVVFALVFFHDPKNYHFAHEENIQLVPLFKLEEFGTSKSLHKNLLARDSFEVVWHFRGNNPNLFYEIPKSNPVIDKDKIFFGTDNGIFLALNQIDGKVVWKLHIKHSFQNRGIFSTPIIRGNKVYLTARNGYAYALNKKMGTIIWKSRVSDWIMSSPVLAKGLDLIFVGCEFGLLKRRGAVKAISLTTGAKKWTHVTMEPAHSSPTYCLKKKTVAIGTDEGKIFLLGAENGEVAWEYQTKGSIKGAPVFDKNGNLVVAGSSDGYLYILDTKTGIMLLKYRTEDAIQSTPLIHNSYVYFSSLDKKVYCIDLNTGILRWTFETKGSVFSSPRIIQNFIYVGSNDGKMYILDAETGKLQGGFQTTERITGSVVYNQKARLLFLPTSANEIYCLKEKGGVNLLN